MYKIGLAFLRSPGSKPRSGVTRDIGCMVELLPADNELANLHPHTARLQLPGGKKVCGSLRPSAVKWSFLRALRG